MAEMKYSLKLNLISDWVPLGTISVGISSKKEGYRLMRMLRRHLRRALPKVTPYIYSSRHFRKYSLTRRARAKAA